MPSHQFDGSAYYFELFASPADTPDGDVQQDQQTLYSSESIQSTCNPDWAAISWPDAVKTQLRTITTIVLHVYVAHTSPHQVKRPVPGQIIPHHAVLEATAGTCLNLASDAPQHHPEAQLKQHIGHQEFESATAISDSDTSNIPDAEAEAASDTSSIPDADSTHSQQAEHDDVKTPSQQDANDSESNHSQEDRSYADSTAMDQEQQQSRPQTDASRTVSSSSVMSAEQGQSGSQVHTSEAISGRSLVMTAEINLNELHVFHPDLAALNVCLPPNTLVLELTEGWCLFPSLDVASASGDQAQHANHATANAPDTPGSSTAQELSSAAGFAPTIGSLSEQKARQQLAESLLNRPAQPTSPATPVPAATTPEVGRLRGLVKAKLGFAFGSGPDLAGLHSPPGASSEHQARMASALQASTSGRPEKALKVDVAGLDKQMVTLMRKQQQLQAALDRKEDLCQTLSQALDHHNTAQQQHLRLDALRHAREQHKQRAENCQACIDGMARSQDLSRTILKAQLQSLQHALQTLKAAKQRLDSADVMVKGPEGGLRWRPLHAALVGRRCSMATLLGKLYAVGPQTVTVCQAPANGFLEDQLERGWWAGSDAGSSCSGSPKALIVTRRKQATNASKNGFRQAALLTIGGLDLDPLLGKGGLNGIMNWEGDRHDMRKAAAALGYLAAVVERLGFYLDVPLRYPIRLGNCKSLMLSHAGTAGNHSSTPTDQHSADRQQTTHSMTAFSKRTTAGTDEFPLYCEGVDRGRFAYAIYLLNKDVEQLLNEHGLTGTGASQVLANLHKLLAAAASA